MAILKDLARFINQECIYMESGLILSTKVLGFGDESGNITAHLLITSPMGCIYNRIRLNGEPLVNEWYHRQKFQDELFTISMPAKSAIIENPYKIYFGASWGGGGIRMYFIPEFVALFKKQDMTWWDELHKYNYSLRDDLFDG